KAFRTKKPLNAAVRINRSGRQTRHLLFQAQNQYSASQHGLQRQAINRHVDGTTMFLLLGQGGILLDPMRCPVVAQLLEGKSATST
ncbi:TPA: hypothetical protein QDC44_007498, partial [Burkholderia cepacia ATCC 25416]|nr:hypothetical protein [Burkholderia cepacia ATCC 25416]